MMNRQNRKEAVSLIKEDGLIKRIDIGGKILVGQHHPFGVSGRSGGVLNNGQVFDSNLFSSRIVFEGPKHLRKMITSVDHLQGDEDGVFIQVAILNQSFQ